MIIYSFIHSIVNFCTHPSPTLHNINILRSRSIR